MKEIPTISHELQTILQRIVDDVVVSLGCVGAMVATLEQHNALPVRAYSVSVPGSLLRELENKLGTSLIGPRSVAYLDNERFKENLSTRAVRGAQGQPEQYIVSNQLYDLFRPVVNKPLSDFAQTLTNIKQVIAVPFFLSDEVVGNLFAASTKEFSPQDIKFLTAFGHQAATAIQSQRRLAQARALEGIIFDLQLSLTDAQKTFQVVTDAVVNRLGYLAAFVAPRIGSTLPVRAYTVNSDIINRDFIESWQNKLGFDLLGGRAVAYLDRPDYAEQLSVRAVKSRQVQVSDSLYDLVRPVVPKAPTDTIQKLLSIKQVTAIPFFLEGDVIGNLYVVSQRRRFSRREQQVLQAFGLQAAIGLRNAQLYQKSEERRQAAQIFAKMAFSSAAYAHTLRNHISAFRMYFQMIDSQLPSEKFRGLGQDVMHRLNEAADILDNLHEPWRERPDSRVSVNACLNQAIKSVIPHPQEFRSREKITLHVELTEDLLPIKTSPDILTEAFKVLIENALDAVRKCIKKKGGWGDLWIESHRAGESAIEVLIRDNGIGIKPENLSKIFEMSWSTKKAGMGFGLFWTKDYVEGLGGSIRVESAWQEGTIFYITLPVPADI